MSCHGHSTPRVVRGRVSPKARKRDKEVCHGNTATSHPIPKPPQMPSTQWLKANSPRQKVTTVGKGGIPQDGGASQRGEFNTGSPQSTLPDAIPSTVGWHQLRAPIIAMRVARANYQAWCRTNFPPVARRNKRGFKPLHAMDRSRNSRPALPLLSTWPSTLPSVPLPMTGHSSFGTFIRSQRHQRERPSPPQPTGRQATQTEGEPGLVPINSA